MSDPTQEIAVNINIQLVRDIRIIKENKLVEWKDVAFDLGISYQQLLRIVNGPQPMPMQVKTKVKMRDYIKRNKSYL